LGRRSPALLLFAVSVSFHAALLAMLTLTRIDKKGHRSPVPTFSNLHAVNIDKRVLAQRARPLKGVRAPAPLSSINPAAIEGSTKPASVTNSTRSPYVTSVSIG
jgi:hypothetical protein